MKLANKDFQVIAAKSSEMNLEFEDNKEKVERVSFYGARVCLSEPRLAVADLVVFFFLLSCFLACVPVRSRSTRSPFPSNSCSRSTVVAPRPRSCQTSQTYIRRERGRDAAPYRAGQAQGRQGAAARSRAQPRAIRRFEVCSSAKPTSESRLALRARSSVEV